MATYDKKLLDGNGLVYVVTKLNSKFAAQEDIPVNVSELVNDKNYQDDTQVESIVTSKGYQDATQVNNAITQAISGLTGFHFEIVGALPTTGESNVIYLVLKSASKEGNVYTEYAWINNKWETLRDTSVDIETLSNTEIDEIFSE